jgi:hypothetical protein
MTERADQLHHDNAPAHSTALVKAFLATHHITQACQPPYSTGLSSSDFWLFPNLKSHLKGWKFVNECHHGLVHLRSHSFITYKNVRSEITGDNLKRSLGGSSQIASLAASLSTITSFFHVFIVDKPSNRLFWSKLEQKFGRSSLYTPCRFYLSMQFASVPTDFLRKVI